MLSPRTFALLEHWRMLMPLSPRFGVVYSIPRTLEKLAEFCDAQEKRWGCGLEHALGFRLASDELANYFCSGPAPHGALEQLFVFAKDASGGMWALWLFEGLTPTFAPVVYLGSGGELGWESDSPVSFVNEIASDEEWESELEGAELEIFRAFQGWVSENASIGVVSPGADVTLFDSPDFPDFATWCAQWQR